MMLLGDGRAVLSSIGWAVVTAETWRRARARRTVVSVGRGRPGDSGAAAVEFALVVPILLFLMFGIVDFGMAMYSQTIVGNAAREGARTASLEGTQANAEFAVSQALTGVMGTKPGVVSDPVTATSGFQVKCLTNPADPTSWCPGWTAAGGGIVAAPAGATVTVTIKYGYRWITPIQVIRGIPATLTITRQSTMVVE
jgi:Flp pilus assembly protein TadG